MKRFLITLLFLLYACPLFAASETDTFVRGDSSDIGTSWDPFDDGTGLVPCKILTNAAAATTDLTRCYEGFNHFLPTANQYVEVTFQIRNTSFLGSREFGALVRMTDPASSFSGYICQARTTGSTTRIRRIDKGSSTTLPGGVDMVWADGDVMRCDVTGTTITLSQNGTPIIVAVDATYATGRGGIEILDDPVDDVVNIVSFTVSDGAAAATTVIHRRPMVTQ